MAPFSIDVVNLLLGVFIRYTDVMAPFSDIISRLQQHEEIITGSFSSWKIKVSNIFVQKIIGSVWKISFFTGNAYYKNGAITNFVLFHTLKTVWEWGQIFNLCLKYAKTWINTLYLEWRHFLVNISPNVNFPLIFQGFSSKNA